MIDVSPVASNPVAYWMIALPSLLYLLLDSFASKFSNMQKNEKVEKHENVQF